MDPEELVKRQIEILSEEKECKCNRRATKFCQQCETRFCDSCFANAHPEHVPKLQLHKSIPISFKLYPQVRVEYKRIRDENGEEQIQIRPSLKNKEELDIISVKFNLNCISSDGRVIQGPMVEHRHNILPVTAFDGSCVVSCKIESRIPGVITGGSTEKKDFEEDKSNIQWAGTAIAIGFVMVGAAAAITKIWDYFSPDEKAKMKPKIFEDNFTEDEDDDDEEETDNDNGDSDKVKVVEVKNPLRKTDSTPSGDNPPKAINLKPVNSENQLPRINEENNEQIPPTPSTDDSTTRNNLQPINLDDASSVSKRRDNLGGSTPSGSSLSPGSSPSPSILGIIHSNPPIGKSPVDGGHLNKNEFDEDSEFEDACEEEEDDDDDDENAKIDVSGNETQESVKGYSFIKEETIMVKSDLSSAEQITEETKPKANENENLGKETLNDIIAELSDDIDNQRHHQTTNSKPNTPRVLDTRSHEEIIAEEKAFIVEVVKFGKPISEIEFEKRVCGMKHESVIWCDNDGTTPLHWASENGYDDCIRVLLKYSSSSVEFRQSANRLGDRPLHIAAKHGHLKCIRELLKDSEVNYSEVQNKDSLTALHFAARFNHYQCCEELLANGDEILREIFDKHEFTALHYAARNGHFKCCKVLLHGSRYEYRELVDKDKWTALHLAARNGHYKCLKVLLKNSQPNYRQIMNKDNLTALHMAAACNHDKCCEMLLNEAADGYREMVNGEDGISALHAAAIEGNVNCIGALLNGSSDEYRYITNKDGWTALHFAARYGHQDSIKLLLKDSKDDYHKQKTKFGTIAKDLAKRWNHTEAVSAF